MITRHMCQAKGNWKVFFAFGAMNYFCCIVLFGGEHDVQNDSC